MPDFWLNLSGGRGRKREGKVGEVTGVVRVVIVIGVVNGNCIKVQIKHKGTRIPDKNIQVVSFATLCFFTF
jgi:hypothetical protein